MFVHVGEPAGLKGVGGSRTVPREISYACRFFSFHLSLGQGMVVGLFLKSPMSGKVKGNDDNV